MARLCLKPFFSVSSAKKMSSFGWQLKSIVKVDKISWPPKRKRFTTIL